MSPVPEVAYYSVAIVLGALGGALIPTLTHREERLVTLLSFAAGVMFGAAFFHMLPEALHDGGYRVLTWVPAGFALMLLLERFVLTHVCEEPPECTEHGHGPGKTIGLAAFFGLSVHTLFDGVALGSAAAEGVGLMAFVAITAHKIPSSLSLATIFLSEGRSRRVVLGYGALFGLMVPVGAALYFGLDSAVGLAGFTPGALAFSAGTFLYIAVSDLLPHVNRHGKESLPRNVLAMIVGLALMFALTYATAHEHGAAVP